MRRSGKTTRAVDYAIQYLFTMGEVLLPRTRIDFSQYPRSKVAYVTGNIVQDPDSANRNQMEYFIERVIKRLESEHSHCFNVIKENDFVRIIKNL